MFRKLTLRPIPTIIAVERTTMTHQNRRADLARRLTDAGNAHAAYEQNVLHGKYDEQWAQWYASYLVEQGWNDLFARPWDVGELKTGLSDAHAAHRTKAPDSSWQEYYAGIFDERK